VSIHVRQVRLKKKYYYDPDVVIDYYKEFGIMLVPEYKFTEDRDFRFDFAEPNTKVALEVQGAVWKGSRGGHTSGAGYIRDMEKSNLAMSQGWRIIQCVPKDVCMRDTAEVFQQTMEVSIKSHD
jgi:hypothetical protein